MSILKFMKNWTLPIAMLVGVVSYFCLSRISFLSPVKPVVNAMVEFLTPTLIFAQLFLTFCKVSVSDLKPIKWHLWLLLIQFSLCMLIALVLITIAVPHGYREVLEGIMVCFICPTATAAAVITAKLGGNAGSLSTYTLLSNFLAAIIVPLVFPLVEIHADVTFWDAFMRILSKVFPLLICPFLLATLLRYCMPKIHAFFLNYTGLAFYLWAVALAIVSGQTTRSIVLSDAAASIKWMIAIGALLACCLQFILGKSIGGHYNDRLSAGQALGQKNTVLAIWMAYTYLNPLSSVAPGSYVLWQNSINSWQLWKKRKEEEKEALRE